MSVPRSLWTVAKRTAISQGQPAQYELCPCVLFALLSPARDFSHLLNREVFRVMSPSVPLAKEISLAKHPWPSFWRTNRASVVNWAAQHFLLCVADESHWSCKEISLCTPEQGTNFITQVFLSDNSAFLAEITLPSQSQCSGIAVLLFFFGEILSWYIYIYIAASPSSLYP